MKCRGIHRATAIGIPDDASWNERRCAGGRQCASPENIRDPVDGRSGGRNDRHPMDVDTYPPPDTMTFDDVPLTGATPPPGGQDRPCGMGAISGPSWRSGWSTRWHAGAVRAQLSREPSPPLLRIRGAGGDARRPSERAAGVRSRRQSRLADPDHPAGHGPEPGSAPSASHIR